MLEAVSFKAVCHSLPDLGYMGFFLELSIFLICDDPPPQRGNGSGGQVFKDHLYGITDINPGWDSQAHQSFEGAWGQRPAGLMQEWPLETFYPSIKTGMLGHPANQRAQGNSECHYSCDQIAGVSVCLGSAIRKNSPDSATGITTW